VACFDPEWPSLILGAAYLELRWASQFERTTAQQVRETTSTFTHIAAAVAGLATFVTGFTVSRRGLLKAWSPLSRLASPPLYS
jgi:hypothetical protein